MFKKLISLVNVYVRDKNLDKDVEIKFIDKKAQKQMMQEVNKMGVSDTDIKAIFYDAHTDKLGSQRGIQNLSVLAAHYHLNKSKNFDDIIMHRLDDDMFPINMRYERDGIYSIKMIPSFFCRKRMSFKEKNARILASYYTIDTPSQIIDLFEAVEAIDTIANNIKEKDIRGDKFDWDKISGKLYVYGAPKAILLENIPRRIEDLLNIYTISETSKINDILSQVNELLGLLGNCVNRFEYNLANFTEEYNWFMPREALPGGCVSNFIGEEFAPGPNFGTHDVMWSSLEYNKRGGTYGDFPIGHIKTGSDRPKFVSNLVLSDDSKMRCDHAYAYHAIKYLKKAHNKNNKDFMTSDKEFADFTVFGRDIVDKTKERMLNIQDKMLKVNNENSKAIYSFFDPLVKNYQVVIERYKDKVIDEKKVKELTDKWLNSENAWFSIRKKIRRK
ncbi:MAG: hypothetical protein ABIG88_01900 [Patescibacteria group bacterium]